MSSPVQKLMAKEVDRKEFLAYIGAVLLTLTGISGFIKAVTEPHTGSRAAGYGSSAYGGSQEGR